MFDDNITDIFKNSNLIEIKETSKVGLEQINEKICVNAYWYMLWQEDLKFYLNWWINWKNIIII